MYSFSLYSAYVPTQPHGIQCKLRTDNSQIRISSLDLPRKLQTCKLFCLLDFSIGYLTVILDLTPPKLKPSSYPKAHWFILQPSPLQRLVPPSFKLKTESREPLFSPPHTHHHTAPPCLLPPTTSFHFSLHHCNNCGLSASALAVLFNLFPTHPLEWIPPPSMTFKAWCDLTSVWIVYPSSHTVRPSAFWVYQPSLCIGPFTAGL